MKSLYFDTLRINWEIVQNNMKDDQKVNMKTAKKKKNIKDPMIWISLLKELLIVNGIDGITTDAIIRIIYQTLGVNSKSNTLFKLLNNCLKE